MKRIFVLSAFLLSFAPFTLGCDKKIPIWNKDIYVGNSVGGTIDRAQAGVQISANDPRFDDYICVNVKDWDCLVETFIANAKGWAKQSACGLEPSRDQ